MPQEDLDQRIHEYSSGESNAHLSWNEFKITRGDERVVIGISLFMHPISAYEGQRFNLPSKAVPMIVHVIAHDQDGNHTDLYSIDDKGNCLAHTYSRNGAEVKKDTSVERLRPYLDIIKKHGVGSMHFAISNRLYRIE